MPFTKTELHSAANAALGHHLRGQQVDTVIMDDPMADMVLVHVDEYDYPGVRETLENWFRARHGDTT